MLNSIDEIVQRVRDMDHYGQERVLSVWAPIMAATLTSTPYSENVGSLHFLVRFVIIRILLNVRRSSFEHGNIFVSSDANARLHDSDHRPRANPSTVTVMVLATEFEQLAMPLAGSLYATAYRLTGNATRAEDLVQETYVKAWQRFQQFQAGTNFKAWIFRILILTSRNENRTQRKQPVQLSEESVRQIEKVESNELPRRADDSINYDAFLDDDFKRALDRLDAEHRSVLMLVTLGELSYQECADTLELPIGTVMSRLYRARKQMQVELHDYALERGLLRSGSTREVR